MNSIASPLPDFIDFARALACEMAPHVSLRPEALKSAASPAHSPAAASQAHLRALPAAVHPASLAPLENP